MRRLSLLFAVLVIVLFGIWGLSRYSSTRTLVLPRTLIAAYKAYGTHVAYPVHITVGDTISIPVEEAQTVNGSMEISPTAANHVFNSALPGEEGNIIILGNNLTSVFGLLAQARIGDLVTLRTGDGNLYTYIITQIRVEIPDQIGLLAPTSSEVLTLYTQTGLLNSQRLIVKAEPVK